MPSAHRTQKEMNPEDVSRRDSSESISATATRISRAIVKILRLDCLPIGPMGEVTATSEGHPLPKERQAGMRQPIRQAGPGLRLMGAACEAPIIAVLAISAPRGWWLTRSAG
jgi:hypothetical protein